MVGVVGSSPIAPTNIIRKFNYLWMPYNAHKECDFYNGALVVHSEKAQIVNWQRIKYRENKNIYFGCTRFAMILMISTFFGTWKKLNK